MMFNVISHTSPPVESPQNEGSKLHQNNAVGEKLLALAPHRLIGTTMCNNRNHEMSMHYVIIMPGGRTSHSSRTRFWESITTIWWLYYDDGILHRYSLWDSDVQGAWRRVNVCRWNEGVFRCRCR